MARFFNRSTCAVLLAGVLSCFVPASNVCGAVCNPAPGEETELKTFTVKDGANPANKAVVDTGIPGSNPGKLYICGDTADIQMDATVSPLAARRQYVGWRIEKETGAGNLMDTPHANPNQGNVAVALPPPLFPGNESSLTVGAPEIRQFYVKAFCDGDKNGQKDAGEDFYYDTDGKVIEVQVVVPKVDLSAIKFNHKGSVTSTDPGPDMTTSDGLNIRQSYASDLGHADHTFAGEWVPFWGRNEPFLYVVDEAVTIKVRFTIEPAVTTTLTIGADAVGGVFPNVTPKAVDFVGGVSVGDAGGYVEFDLTGKSHEFDENTTEDLAKSSDSWQWKITTPFACNFAVSGPHTCYCIFIPPINAWYTAMRLHPWVDALEAAIVDAGAAGKTTMQPAVAAVTAHCFSGLSKAYDYEYADSHYNALYNGSANFDLTAYLNPTPGVTSRVNCYDQACAVFLIASVLGCTIEYDYLDDFGYLKPTYLVGLGGPMNNPREFNLEDPDDIYPDRYPFSNHSVAKHAGKIHDATVGPHEGTQDIVDYANSATDLSSAAERSGSLDDNADGTLTSVEVSGELTVGDVTGMH